MAASGKTKFRLYAPGRRLRMFDMSERRRLTGSTGIAALFAAAALVLFRFAMSVWPSTTFASDALWSTALKHLIIICLIPLLASGLMQFAKKPSARFVLGSGHKSAYIPLSILTGVALALMASGASLLMSRVFPDLTFAVVPPLLTDAIVPLKSTLPAHLLVIVLGVVLSSATLTLLTFGYVAPCLDIGWHRLRAVLGSACFFALLFASTDLLPAMLAVGFCLALIRLNTDSLYAAIAALSAYLLVGFFRSTILQQLSFIFFGQIRLDAENTYQLALIILLSGAALCVPSFVFLSGMWNDQHKERLREALSAVGDKPLPQEPDRPLDLPFLLSLALLAGALLI